MLAIGAPRMANETDDQATNDTEKSSGSKFMVLSRANWDRLLKSKKLDNPLNAACAYLVMLAGTGPDNATTSWSARSFETYLGMRKSNGQKAIECLAAAGLVTIEKAGKRPRYKLTNPAPKDAEEEECIFLPNQLVTGFGGQPSLLRRLRETGDITPLALLMGLYGAVQDDITLGLDGSLHGTFADGHEHPIGAERKFGANSIWTVEPGTMRFCTGSWWRAAGTDPWPAIKILEQIRAIEHENWLFCGAQSDADPLVPWDDEVATWNEVAAQRLCEEGYWTYLSERGQKIVVLASHMGAPAIRSVYRPCVMADTPRRRGRYMEMLEIKRAAIARWQEIAGSTTNVVPFSAARRAI